MKILLFTQYFPPEIGAAQSRLDAITRLAVDLGHEVEIVTAMPSYPTDQVFPAYRGRWFLREVHDRRRVTRTWAWPSMGTGMRRMASYAAFAATGLYGLLRSATPDVLVVESPPLTMGVPGVLWSRLRRVPLVFNVADLWPDAAVAVGALHEGRVLRAMLWLEAWVYRRSALVTTVTDGLVHRLADDKGVPPGKVHLLPNGVDTEQFRPDAGDPDFAATAGIPAHPFLLYAGTMGLAHGMDPLIDAFAELSTDPTMPHLVLLGSGSERPRLERKARDAGLPNVHFLDPISPSDLARIMPLAVAGVVTMAEIPLNEMSRPAKLFPVMACGIPVLYAGAGEGAIAVRESGGGIVVSNRVDAIVAAVRELAAAPDRRAEVGAAGRRYVEAIWSWRGIVTSWLDRLSEVVGSQR